ncbi:MAG: oxygen-dependent coproporphyrinogen oxidase [Bacteroidota bacterium]
MDFKDKWISFIHQLQDDICTALENSDGKAKFIEYKWERPEGGGGKTRVISNGNVIEKGGVNTSVVYGDVTDLMRSQLKINGDKWFACGMSIVIHPINPFVPTVHCNYRMFELYNEENIVIDRWFGGGTDLTPYYLFEEDAKHFHQTYKTICDKFNPLFYHDFKKQCDDYFVNTHRNNERRGIGGIFYDYQRASEKKDVHFWMNFAKACGHGFIDSYVPIIEKRKATQYTDKNKHWQEIRRGRYTEFNLVHDRGTIFGLKTNGRTESILMSLPPTVRFEYNFQPDPGSEEDKLLQVCLHPKDWLNLNNISEDEWASKVNTC